MWLLKECSALLSPFLFAVCNTSLRSVVVPASCKTAIVTPTLKRSSVDINTLQNSRPISNLSFISKLFERLVSTQLQSHLDTHSLLTRNQSPNRCGHSTKTAPLKVCSDLIGALDSNSDNLSVLAVLDMTAAFDTVDHSIYFCTDLNDRMELVAMPYIGLSLTSLTEISPFRYERANRLVVLYCTAYLKGSF